MKINEKTIRKSIRRFLFETSYNKYTTDDKIAGNLGDDRDDKNIPQALPIMPANQMATQLSGEEPPIEDESFKPSSNAELARAASAISKTIPDEAMDYYYNELVRVAEKARNRENKTVDLTPDGPADEIKSPLNARKKNKKGKKIRKEYAKPRGRSYINNVTKSNKGVGMTENNNNKKPDFYDEEEDEFTPSPEDMMDFAYEFPDAPLEDAPGFARYKSQYAVGFSPEYKLDDIAKTNVKPGVKGASGMKGWIERTIFPVIQSIYSVPQFSDRLTSLVRSQFARDAFFDGMKAAELLTTEEISELNSGDPTKLMDSSMYKFVMTYMFIRPSTTMLRNLEKQGGIDLQDDRSQLAPHEAQDLIEKLKTRWVGMSKQRKANDARNGMQAYLEYLERDAAVMG